MKSFLALRGVAGESNEYLLYFGQVYHWLGKHEEGHQQFEKLLAANQRGFAMLVAVATTMREVGIYTETRKLIEEAYANTNDRAEKQQVAHLRALTSLDQDDRIEWLRRSDTDSPGVKADLAGAPGSKALNEYLERMMVLSPKRSSSYAMASSIYAYTRDVDAHGRMSERIAAAQPDLSETTDRVLKYYHREVDDKLTESWNTQAVRMEKVLDACRRAGLAI